MHIPTCIHTHARTHTHTHARTHTRTHTQRYITADIAIDQISFIKNFGNLIHSVNQTMTIYLVSTTHRLETVNGHTSLSYYVIKR